MKKFFLPIIITIILLAGCSTEKDLFSKKQECGNLIDEVQNRISEQYGMDDRIVELKKIFYSNKANSCLYEYYISENVGTDNLFTYRLVDAFTEEILFEREGCLSGNSCAYSFTEAEKYIEEKIQEYE